MNIDREIKELIDEVRKQPGWSVTFISNNCRILMRGPKGQKVICAVTAKTPHTIRGIRKELARKGCDLGYSAPPVGAVRAAWEEAIARRERKLTPQECGEDREPAEVIIRHPKGSGNSASPSTTVTTTTTISTGGDMANPQGPPRQTSISEALAAGVNVSEKVQANFTDDLTCKTCNKTLLSISATGIHMAMHERQNARDAIVDVTKALEVITDALTKPTNTDEVADLKRRLKMVKDAMNKDIMGMAQQIGKALDGLDL